MRPLFRFVLPLALLGASAHAQPASPLRVIRATPTGDAPPSAEISVTFDRPVAGSLDRTVDPATVLRVEPAVRGRLEWRDPVTVRLVPAQPLVPGTRYAVTVANAFRAMDGSALAEPYRFAFRAQGPRLLAGNPVTNDEHPRVPPTQRFELVYSAPVDLAKLSGAAFAEFSAACAGGRTIVRLRAAGQRAVRDADAWRVREAGGYQRDRKLDSLRRVVQLAPETALPRGCAGELVVPNEVEDERLRDPARWAFETYGDFRVAKVECGDDTFCPTGPLRVTLSTPVRGSEVLRRVSLVPKVPFAVRDTAGEATTWTLEARLTPHVTYAVVVDTAARDVFGQPLRGNPASAYRTTGYAPSITYAYGRLLVERTGFRTLAVQHVNVDTLVATIAPVPDTLEARILARMSWGDDSVWSTLARRAVRQRIPVQAVRDRAMLTGIKLPTPDPARRAPTLYAIKVAGRSATRDTVADGPLALVQVTDLGVHARLGAAEAAVWVTGVNDGLPRPNAAVTLYDTQGRRLGASRTDARGLARLTGLPRASAQSGDDEGSSDLEGYVTVALGDDRAVASVSRYDPDLSPWRFDMTAAWDAERLPLAGAVFTERGIYRPGERVFAKAIVRDGLLGTLRVPAAGDSVKWIFHDRDEGVLRERTVRLSAFGTADQAIDVPARAAVGRYRVELQARRQGKWQSFADASYRVAEYRPPEFLVDMAADSGTRLPGGRLTATVQARYLFGAPMARAAVAWSARQSPVSAWEIEFPGLDGWYVGESDAWWEDAPAPEATVVASGVDTLDARGARTLAVKLPDPPNGRAARVTLEATVTDVNRQVVGSSTSAIVHPADFYVAAKPEGTSYFWQGGVPQSVGVLAVRPNGQKVSGVRVRGAVVRREWHRVRRERDGISELVGEWVADTVARCAITTADAPAPCAFTPKEGGIYIVAFTATDAAGRRASTSFQRWAAGKEWVPWSDETQFKMDVIADRQRYSVGDTATVLFASPFTNAEAWITVEREGLIEQRRLRLTSGSTTLKFPITEAYAPNAFVSIVVSRGRSAPPGPADDPGRPTIRVGYAELRVTPEVKRLTVAVRPERAEYRPGDSARVALHVADARGRGARSEVTLWAVDEGVLALTGYTTPDPIDLVYQARGLGMRLASNMTNVAPQVPEGEKGKREPGGGGGAMGADVLRSRFQTTAFFLGSVVTDANGDAVATAKLPDNLTTFRAMAVAVTAGDRYGKGDAELLVTRPLLARQALPRFVRPGDDFVAGAVVNRRDGSATPVRVRAAATGVSLRGDADRTVTLAAGRGTDVRFPFRLDRENAPDDSAATFRFDVSAGADADAVRVTVPVKPDYHPRAFVAAGVLRDTATVDLQLPPGIDPQRSRVTLTVGGSPLATVRGIARQLRVYPYDCTEQVTSEALPILALHRAAPNDTTRREIARAVDVLSRRQRADGGIGYWSPTDWTSAWLSAYAGAVLLDARDVGVPVDSAVLRRLAEYISADLKGTGAPQFTPVANRRPQREVRLSDQVAAVDFLSRYGRADAAAENSLVRSAALLGTEDRARLAEVLARRGQLPAARRLLEPTWRLVQLEGRRAVLPESTTTIYFESSVRPVARLLTATLAVDPEHALVGPLVETIAQQGRAAAPWNTQDYASAVTALVAYDRVRKALGGDRPVEVRDARNRVALRAAVAHDSTVPLAGLVAGAPNEPRLAARLQAGPGDAPMYWYVTVTEVPTAPPVTPEDRGIRVERWYESYPAGTPLTRVADGELVRVRLRLTVPATRQFVVLDDALPAGLEAVDLSLRTASAMPGPGASAPREAEQGDAPQWGFGRWDAGWWTPFDHQEIRDDRVVYSASVLWPGTYTATYLARATTAGTFVKPPAHAEEMYNPGVHGRSDGGNFVVTEKRP